MKLHRNSTHTTTSFLPTDSLSALTVIDAVIDVQNQAHLPMPAAALAAASIKETETTELETAAAEVATEASAAED